MRDKFDVFADTLEKELHERYQVCNDAATTPSSILLAVLNAVAEARKTADKATGGACE